MIFFGQIYSKYFEIIQSAHFNHNQLLYYFNFELGMPNAKFKSFNITSTNSIVYQVLLYHLHAVHQSVWKCTSVLNKLKIIQNKRNQQMYINKHSQDKNSFYT